MSTRFPAPPGVVARVVQAAADPDTSIAALASLLEKDAVLSAQVLRTVNSAAFGLRRKVGSVDRAVGLMGIRAVRNLVLALGLRDLVPKSAVGEFPLDAFWESSLRRASAAQCFAERLGLPEVQEFFTMGLCQDIGVLVRIQEDEELAANLSAILQHPAGERLGVEQDAGRGHDEVGFAMFSEWNFPEELSIPIRYHHDPDACPEEHAIRARVAHAAEALADLSLVDDKREAMQEAAACIVALGLEDVVASTIVERVNELVADFAELLGLSVAEQPTFEEIVATASRGLADLNLSYEQTTRQLQEALDEQHRMASELQQLNRELEQQALTDPLTGLANRRSFDDALLREIAVAQRQGTALSLVLIDIDHFKQVNDTHGHQAGDLVLKRVGCVLDDLLRSSDTAARQGGEEFAAILPFTSDEGAKIVAERIRRAIEELSVDWRGRSVQVTVSCGGVTLENTDRADATSCEVFTRMADDALYRAKSEGRNCVIWSPS